MSLDKRWSLRQAAIAGRVELLGGDKSGQWNAWYEAAIPVADGLYDIYLEELREEGLIE